MFFICAPGKREKVCRKLVEKGGEIMEFSFDDRGARTGKLDVGEYTSRIVGSFWSKSALPAKGN